MQKHNVLSVLLVILSCGCEPCCPPIPPPRACQKPDAGTSGPTVERTRNAFGVNEKASSQLEQMKALFETAVPNAQMKQERLDGHQSLSLEQHAAARDYTDLLPELAQSLAADVARDALAVQQLNTNTLLPANGRLPSVAAFHEFLRLLSDQRKALGSAAPKAEDEPPSASIPETDLQTLYIVAPVTCEECVAYCDSARWRDCGACMSGWAEKLATESHLEVCRCWPTGEAVEWPLLSGCLHIIVDRICTGH